MSEPYKHDDKSGVRDWGAQSEWIVAEFYTRYGFATSAAKDLEAFIAQELREAYTAGLGDAERLAHHEGEICKGDFDHSGALACQTVALRIRALAGSAKEEERDG
jgi:hypothetical protein